MNKLEDIVDAIVVTLILVAVSLFVLGCRSVKYGYKTDEVEIEARYFCFLNQEVEGLSLNTDLFQAKLDEQNSNNDEAVESMSGVVGDVVSKLVIP